MVVVVVESEKQVEGPRGSVSQGRDDRALEAAELPNFWLTWVNARMGQKEGREIRAKTKIAPWQGHETFKSVVPSHSGRG